MPWFYRAPTPPPPRQCRVVSWYLAQFWNTDEWGKTVTWVGYAAAVRLQLATQVPSRAPPDLC